MINFNKIYNLYIYPRLSNQYKSVLESRKSEEYFFPINEDTFIENIQMLIERLGFEGASSLFSNEIKIVNYLTYNIGHILIVKSIHMNTLWIFNLTTTYIELFDTSHRSKNRYIQPYKGVYLGKEGEINIDNIVCHVYGRKHNFKEI